MEWVRNFPFIAIMLAMVSGPVSSVLPGRYARRVSFLVVITSGLLSVCVLAYVLQTGEAFTYKMGAFPAPFGNEIRAGVLEAMMATFFCPAGAVMRRSMVFSDPKRGFTTQTVS